MHFVFRCGSQKRMFKSPRFLHPLLHFQIVINELHLAFESKKKLNRAKLKEKDN